MLAIAAQPFLQTVFLFCTLSRRLEQAAQAVAEI
jgi:hypothetical protein